MKKELNGKDSEINQLNSKLVEMRISMKAAGEDNEKIKNSVLNFPNELKELLDQKKNQKLIE